MGRNGFGHSPASYRKHALLKRVIEGQCYAYQVKHPDARLLLCDMHAGNGQGVVTPNYQPDFFATTNGLSLTSAQVLVQLAHMLPNAAVVLCESHGERRKALQQAFPQTAVMPNYHDLLQLPLYRYDWALLVSDPNGHSNQGVEVMAAVGEQIAADFVVIWNALSWRRHMGVMVPPPDAPRGVHQTYIRKGLYTWMGTPQGWKHQLGRKKVAWTEEIRGSDAFRYRVIVAANYLSHATKQHPFEQREGI